MKLILHIVIALSFFTLAACQNSTTAQAFSDQTGNISTQSSSTQLVQSSGGSLYSVSCLQTNAQLIQKYGQSVINQCKLTTSSTSTSSSVIYERGIYSSDTEAQVFYPPRFWNPSGALLGTSGSDPFCHYILGGNYGIDCYQLLGYSNPANYPKAFVSECSTCLNSGSGQGCQNTCYQNQLIRID